jgi:hypothetical protein
MVASYDYRYFVISFVIMMMIVSAAVLLIKVSPQIAEPAMARFNPLSTYNLVIHDKTYTINYQIIGGRINNITEEKDNRTLSLGISSASNGTLTIELPRNVIDSEKQGANVDGTYAVFVDGQQAPTFDETKKNAHVRVLSVPFDNGTEQIEIVGTEMASAITPQIPISTSATAASVSPPPSLEVLAGGNVTKAPAKSPTNIRSAKVPSNLTAALTNVTAPTSVSPPPSLEELAGSNVSKGPGTNATASAAIAPLSNATVPAIMKVTTPKAPITPNQVRTPQHHFCIFGSVEICV